MAFFQTVRCLDPLKVGFLETTGQLVTGVGTENVPLKLLGDQNLKEFQNFLAISHGLSESPLDHPATDLQRLKNFWIGLKQRLPN